MKVENITNVVHKTFLLLGEICIGVQLYQWFNFSVVLKNFKITSQGRNEIKSEQINKHRASPHQQVISATSCKDFRYSPLPPPDERHKLEDDSAVLLHFVNQAQIDQDLPREMPYKHVKGSRYRMCNAEDTVFHHQHQNNLLSINKIFSEIWHAVCLNYSLPSKRSSVPFKNNHFSEADIIRIAAQ